MTLFIGTILLVRFRYIRAGSQRACYSEFDILYTSPTFSGQRQQNE